MLDIYYDIYSYSGNKYAGYRHIYNLYFRNFFVPITPYQMVIHHATGLHERIANGGADEFKAVG